MQSKFERIKEILGRWGRGNKSIRKIYVYGSRARGDFNENSDLDIAIELDLSEGDENIEATWISEGKKLKKELQLLLPEYSVHLELYDEDKTPTVKTGIENSGKLVYSRND